MIDFDDETRGVYYDPYTDSFRKAYGAKMSIAFYDRWISRKSEFPVYEGD